MLTLLTLIAAAAAAPTCTSTVSLADKAGKFTDGTDEKSLYDNDERRCWTIKPDCGEGGHVSVWFPRVDVETGYDVVHVYTLGGTLLSKAVSQGGTFSGDGFVVAFSSDSSVTRTGFTAGYSCDVLPEEDTEPVEDER